MISDEDLRKTFSLEKSGDDIIVLTILANTEGDADYERVAALIRSNLESILSQYPEIEFKVLVDITRAGDVKTVGGAAGRHEYIKMIKRERLVKVAVVGQGVVIKTLIGFIAHAAGLGSKLKWFTSREVALGWLNE